jgi:hypothetical protein
MTIIFRLVALALLILPVPGRAAGTGDALDLSWAHLVPPAAQTHTLKSKSFLGGARPPLGPDGAEPTPPAQSPEAPWMSSRSQQPDTNEPPAVVAELDGKRIRIGGYVVPLDFDATKVKEFLLVPFVGACIHVPPPPPNQIIYVKAADAFEIGGQFDPVYVTGTLKTLRQFTGLAATGYTIESADVKARKE